MARHWEDREYLKASIGSQGWWGHFLWFLGLAFVLLGIIADAANVTLGLESISWFLMAIAAFLAGLPFYIGLGIGWYLRTIETKGK